jgi:hypothetical protein
MCWPEREREREGLVLSFSLFCNHTPYVVNCNRLFLRE